jgi:hypothetical protein
MQSEMIVYLDAMKPKPHQVLEFTFLKLGEFTAIILENNVRENVG